MNIFDRLNLLKTWHSKLLPLLLYKLSYLRFTLFSTSLFRVLTVATRLGHTFDAFFYYEICIAVFLFLSIQYSLLCFIKGLLLFLMDIINITN